MATTAAPNMFPTIERAISDLQRLQQLCRNSEVPTEYEQKLQVLLEGFRDLQISLLTYKPLFVQGDNDDNSSR